MSTDAHSKHKNRTVPGERLSLQAYEYIRSKLLQQQWTSGHAISHREVAGEIGIGFTPVREAINRLVAEGLLECQPQRGTFVTRVSREDLCDLYDVREALECHAIRKILDGNIAFDEEKMVTCNRNLRKILVESVEKPDRETEDTRRSAWSNADTAFHETLLLLSGNRLAIRLLRELRDKTRIFGHRSSLDPRDLETVIHEHERIIHALQSRDAEPACEEMKKHLRRGSAIALESYDRNRLLAAVSSGTG